MRGRVGGGRRRGRAGGLRSLRVLSLGALRAVTLVRVEEKDGGTVVVGEEGEGVAWMDRRRGQGSTM